MFAYVNNVAELMIHSKKLKPLKIFACLIKTNFRSAFGAEYSLIDYLI
jgi:hypothetical protein